VALQGFDPPELTIKAGETVNWINNAGFPHNVVFDEDDVPVRIIDIESIGGSPHEVLKSSQRNSSISCHIPTKAFEFIYGCEEGGMISLDWRKTQMFISQ